MGAVSAVSSGVSSIVSVLGSLGVGRRARQKEADYMSKLNAKKGVKQTQNIIVIGFSVLAFAMFGYIVYKYFIK